MSMSTHVKGFIPPDEKWMSMKKVWDACHHVGIQPPEEVLEFFQYEKPDDKGVELDIENHASCKGWRDQSREGYEIEIAKLPENVKFIRFYNSY